MIIHIKGERELHDTTRRALVLITGVTLALLSACTPTPEPAEDLEELTLYLGYRPDVQFAPYYAAQEMGYFAEQGFDVTFENVAESDMVVLVGTGEAPFAVVSGEQVLLARANEVPIVYVFEWWEQFPVGVAALAESGIETPADLAGHTVGTPMMEGASYIGLEALLFSAGLTDADLDVQATGFTQVETLLTGRADAVVIYRNNEPIQLAAQGADVTVMPVAGLVSNGLITNEDTLTANPDRVRRMVAAVREGLIYTIEHPGDAYEMAAVYVEGLDDPGVAAVQQEVLAHSIEMWRADQVGVTNLADWESMQEVLLQMGLIETPLDLEAAFTNEFVPQ